jgi:methionyl-tRNA synthetase
MNVLINCVRLLGVLAEPYMPSFSAKLYEIMNIKYTEEHATFLARHFILDDKEKAWILTPERYLNLYPEGSTINEPKPLFRMSNIMAF